MTAANFSACLAFTLANEGGLVDSPDDNGHLTNKGVTLATFEHYCGGGADGLRHITDQQINHIYRVGYWDEVWGDSMPAGLDLECFDFGVNAGPKKSIELLQGVLGVERDGVPGPVTLTAVAKASPSETIAKLALAQKTYYEGLENFDTFGRGWLARTERRTIAAMRMLKP